MQSIPKLFFATAVVCVLLGMVWGIQMSATHDHSLSPAHGHLNLIGFVVMSVMGTYFALTPAAAASPLARLQYGLVIATVVVLVPGIALAIQEQGETLAKIGSILAVLSMALFLFLVLRFGVGQPKTAASKAVHGQGEVA